MLRIERATNSHATLRHAVLRGKVPHALVASPFKRAVQNHRGIEYRRAAWGFANWFVTMKCSPGRRPSAPVIGSLLAAAVGIAILFTTQRQTEPISA